MAVTVKTDFAVDQGEEGPIAAGAHILTGDKFGAALANEDATGGGAKGERAGPGEGRQVESRGGAIFGDRSSREVGGPDG